MKKSIFLTVILGLFCNAIQAQQVQIYPTNWWVGMKWNKVQLLVQANEDNFNKQQVTINYPGVKVEKITALENPHFYAIDMVIAANAKPGKVAITFTKNGSKKVVNWELKARRKGNGTAFAQGATSKDLMYLIMPDRFANGDESNDKIPGMLDQSLNRDSIYYRHGGDLLGVEQKLDYLKDLGVTAIWLNPVIENDRPNRTEHGYAFTNHYVIDRRLGGDAAYQQLIDAAHAKGMKIIQDAVYNHVDLNHVLVKDQPTKDWLHQWKNYTNTTYKDQVLFDPYAANIDAKKMRDGWFNESMPDLNHNNPYQANFLIQHALWTVENFGIDGWRIDTYAYNDLPFMNRCNQAMENEYPNITIFGETWVHGVPNQSYFCQNNFSIPFKSNLQATTDFQTLFYGIQEALTVPFGWTNGVNKLYTTLAQDFVYKDATRQVIFLDNHDLPRFYSVIGEDTAKYKMGFAWLLTARGIPQMYYGNEILMTGFTNPDGWVRLDFKGGWKGDKENKFNGSGRTSKENSLFNYIKTLANYRKKSEALTVGKFMQYVPVDGLYVYFRYTNNNTVMCIMNTGDRAMQVNASDYTERTSGFTNATNIITGQQYKLANAITIQKNEMFVLELK